MSRRQAGRTAFTSMSRIGYLIEPCEPRCLLSALATFVGEHAGPGYQAPDLVYLANHVAAAELPKLDRLQGQLRELLGRQLRLLHTTGRTSLGPMSQQLFNGVPWTTMYVADGDQPHLQIYVKRVSQARDYLAQLRMRITSVVDETTWQVLAGYVPVSALRKLVNTPGLLSVMPSERPTVDVEGIAANQWEALSGADQYRRISPDNNGSGIDVGVISDSVDRVGAGLAGSQLTGDLPMSVIVLLDGPTTGVIDEGRAMLELIYDVAPGAQLYFHAAGDSTATADAYTALKNAGVDVIADDISYFADPVFQQGVLSQRAEAMSVDHDVLVFGSAGNRNNESYAATWSNPNANRYHNFDDSDESLDVTLDSGETISLNLHWNQPWNAATTDIDVEVWNAAQTMKLFDTDVDNTPFGGGGDPYEFLSYANTTGGTLSYHVRFNVVDGGDDGSAATGLQLQAYAPGSRLAGHFSEAYVLDNPGISPNRNSDFTFALGAANHATPNVIETFSSLGPITRYFDDDGTPLGAPITKQQPLFYAADGVATTFPAGPLNPFFGTSAAAPNAAAIAAMALDAAGNSGRGDLTYAELFELFKLSAEGLNAGTGTWIASAGFGQVNGLVAPLAAEGRAPADGLELNQFGNASVTSDIIANSDVDGFIWSSTTTGSTTAGVTQSSANYSPGMILYDAGLDVLLDYDYDSGVGQNPSLTFNGSAASVYQADLFSRTNIIAGNQYDYTLTVDAPDQTVGNISLDGRGDATVNSLLVAGSDVKYFRVTSPAGALGALTIQLTPGAALNGVVSLYDAAGALVARRDNAGIGSPETLTIVNGIPVSTEFVIRVGSTSYGSSGSFALSVNFTSVPGGLPLTWSAPAEGIAVPDRFGVFGDEDGSITPEAFLSAPGEKDSFYFGLNSGNSGALTFSIAAMADNPSPVKPAIAVYRASDGLMVAFTPEGTGSLASLNNIAAVLGTRYIAVIADQTNTLVGDVRVYGSVGSMTANTTLIPLNPEGDGSISLPSPAPAIVAGGEMRRYRFVLPGGANGDGVITFDPGDDDGEVWLFDNSSNVVAFSRSAGPGLPEVLNVTGLAVGSTYELYVLPQNYASNIDIGTISLNFEAITGTATGLMFRDDDRDGTQDPLEPPLAGFRIYFDEDESGTFNLGDDSTFTAADGTYTLTGLRIMQGPLGARVRVDQQPGYTLTFPVGGSYYLFIPVTMPVVTEVNFGNYRQLDFGDAPASYKVTLADDGPRHWLMPGFTLGTGWDGELDGLPSAAALGDDNGSTDDEDGVVLTLPLVPGSTGRFTITAPGGGVLDAWFDFNRDGDFLDPTDRLVMSLTLTAGANTLDMPIPPTAPPGDVFFRFRLTQSGVSSPFGFGDVGEVEDYRFPVGPVAPAPSTPDLLASSDTGPSSDDNVTADASPTLTGTATPGAIVRLFRDGAEVAMGIAGGGTWTLTDPGPAPNGVRSYTATADLGGGQSAPSPALLVTIDTMPPSAVFSTFLFENFHGINVGFTEGVAASLSVSDFVVTHAMFGMVPDFVKMLTYEPMTNVATLTFPGSPGPSGMGSLPDGDYTLFMAMPTVTDLAGNPLTGSVMSSFFALAGDANRDRGVNLLDFNILAGNFGQSPRTFSQGDFNYDTIVNLLDFNLLASRFGVSLAPQSLTSEPFSQNRIIDELDL